MNFCSFYAIIPDWFLRLWVFLPLPPIHSLFIPQYNCSVLKIKFGFAGPLFSWNTPMEVTLVMICWLLNAFHFYLSEISFFLYCYWNIILHRIWKISSPTTSWLSLLMMRGMLIAQAFPSVFSIRLLWRSSLCLWYSIVQCSMSRCWLCIYPGWYSVNFLNLLIHALTSCRKISAIISLTTIT